MSGLSLRRFLNVVEALLVRRYGGDVVGEWLTDTPVTPAADAPKPTVAPVPNAPVLPVIDRATWGTSPQAVAGHHAMMGERPKIVKGR